MMHFERSRHPPRFSAYCWELGSPGVWAKVSPVAARKADRAQGGGAPFGAAPVQCSGYRGNLCSREVYGRQIAVSVSYGIGGDAASIESRNLHDLGPIGALRQGVDADGARASDA